MSQGASDSRREGSYSMKYIRQDRIFDFTSPSLGPGSPGTSGPVTLLGPRIGLGGCFYGKLLLHDAGRISRGRHMSTLQNRMLGTCRMGFGINYKLGSVFGAPLFESL